MKVWILTREINEYDQDGEYFVAVFSGKPVSKELENIGFSPELAQYLIDTTGGRQQVENEWYFLRECECGISNPHKQPTT